MHYSMVFLGSVFLLTPHYRNKFVSLCVLLMLFLEYNLYCEEQKSREITMNAA